MWVSSNSILSPVRNQLRVWVNAESILSPVCNRNHVTLWTKQDQEQSPFVSHKAHPADLCYMKCLYSLPHLFLWDVNQPHSNPP